MCIHPSIHPCVYIVYYHDTGYHVISLIPAMIRSDLISLSLISLSLCSLDKMSSLCAVTIKHGQ